jgi:glycerol-3-phosphate cytidylyltransferase
MTATQRTKVYVGGTFDLFHKGHVELLRRAAQLGDVYVAINTDEFVQEFKHKKPVMTTEERLSVVEACKYVTAAFINHGGADSRPTIQSIDPDYVVVGSDWMNKDYLAQLGLREDFEAAMKQYGAVDLKPHVIYVPYTSNISSTDIRARLQQQ